MAHHFGWTMNEVRDHTWPDLYAMLEYRAELSLDAERAQAMNDLRQKLQANKRRRR